MKYSELSEKIKRGTADFPIEYYYLTPKKLQYVMALHWHREFEIVRVLKGKLELSLDNITYELSRGDFCFIESGTLHKGIPTDCIYECIVFDLNMLLNRTATDKYIRPFLNGTIGLNTIFHTHNNPLGVVVSGIFDALSKKDENFELEVFSLLYKMFALFYKSNITVASSKSRQNLQQNRIIIRQLEWIENHFAEAITLEQLSTVSGLSPKYLCRFFREHTGQTPIEYINNIRINNACHELRHLNRTVTEAAYNSGFNNLSYFTKVFKSFKGITPNQFKNAIKKGM